MPSGVGYDLGSIRSGQLDTGARAVMAGFLLLDHFFGFLRLIHGLRRREK